MRNTKWLYTLPALVFVVAVCLYPLVQLIRMSLSDVTSGTLLNAWPWVGLRNFVVQITSAAFSATIRNTIIFVVIVAGVSVLTGFVVAVVLRGRGRLVNILMAVMVFVWALPPVVTGSAWKFMYAGDGPINVIVQALGLSKIPFLYDPQMAIFSVAAVNTWAVIPFATLVFRAALLGVSADVIEAARLDGARPRQEIWYILIPQVRPTLYVLTVLCVVYGFRSFDFIYIMTSGGPGVATNTLAFLGYSLAFVQYNFGGGAAVSIISAILVVGLAFLYSRSVFREEADAQ